MALRSNELTFEKTSVLGSWNDRKGRLKIKYPFLTESDLHLQVGNRDEMFFNLKTKLGKTSEELHKIIIAL